jgi:hypothetical protein
MDADLRGPWSALGRRRPSWRAPATHPEQRVGCGAVRLDEGRQVLVQVQHQAHDGWGGFRGECARGTGNQRLQFKGFRAGGVCTAHPALRCAHAWKGLAAVTAASVSCGDHALARGTAALSECRLSLLRMPPSPLAAAAAACATDGKQHASALAPATMAASLAARGSQAGSCGTAGASTADWHFGCCTARCSALRSATCRSNGTSPAAAATCFPGAGARGETRHATVRGPSSIVCAQWRPPVPLSMLMRIVVVAGSVSDLRSCELSRRYSSQVQFICHEFVLIE